MKLETFGWRPFFSEQFEIFAREGLVPGRVALEYRGAYRLQGDTLENVSGKVAVPFFKARSVDISVEWRALFRKAFVGEIDVQSPELNFVAPPPKAGPKAKAFAKAKGKAKASTPPARGKRR